MTARSDAVREQEPGGGRVERAHFGILPGGHPVDVITVRNRAGMTMRAMTFGGIILSFTTPDRDGRLADVVLGFDTLGEYLDESPYFGAIVGRYGNRIARGRFSIDGTTYTLVANNGANHLHGGTRGFDKVIWSARQFERDGAAGVALSYSSADGEEGYPGRLDVTVTYTLDDDGALTVDYEAATTAPTVLNLTQHSYFNLGRTGHDVLGHEVTIDADAFTPADATLIPTGEIAPVDGTPFDFRSPTAIGARIDEPHPQLIRGGGYDHNFVLRSSPDAGDAVWNAGSPRRAARVHEPVTGRTLEVATTEPGVQFYTGNFLDGTLRGKSGVSIPRRGGFCLETQHFPDSPNQPAFPSVVLRPGEVFRSRTVFTFGTDAGKPAHG